MQNTLSITIELFGALRQYSQSNPLHLTVTETCSLTEVRKKIGTKFREEHSDFKDDQLIAVSVFAHENQILHENTILKEDTHLTILPPVCGG